MRDLSRRALLASPSLAQEARPVTLVVPFPAGSVTDNVARALGQHLQELLALSVVIDNRPGAQGTLAATHVTRLPADSPTLLIASSLMFVAGSLMRGLGYDPVAGFTPVAAIGSTSLMIVVPAASPLRSLPDLQARVRRADPPMSIGFGSPTAQVILALFTAASGGVPVAVSYRGTPQALTDLAGGHIDAAVVDLFSGLAQMRAGNVRALAVSAAQRSAAAPDVPTLQEGFPSAELTLETVIAAIGPAQMAAPLALRLGQAIGAALGRPVLRERLLALSTTPLLLDGPALAARIRADNPRWEALIRQAGIQPE